MKGGKIVVATLGITSLVMSLLIPPSLAAGGYLEIALIWFGVGLLLALALLADIKKAKSL